MILQLDVGNTLLKWRRCDKQAVQQRGAESRTSMQSLAALTQLPAPDQVWIASVAGSEFESDLSGQLVAAWGITPWFARTEAAACGLHNSYQQPGRMGVDRWLAMIAAWSTAQQAVCVVDAGSALTIDFVAADGEHLGGYILPGIDSMERALLSDTDRVRFADADREQLAPGRSTEEAVYNGLLLSQAGAVSLALQRIEGKFLLYFTGGNGASLQRCLQLGGQFDPELVLDGLQLLAQEKLNGEEGSAE